MLWASSPVEDSEADLQAEPQTAGRSVRDYDVEAQIGEGTYGAVYLATSPGGEAVALKKVLIQSKRQQQEGFPNTAVREIALAVDVVHGRPSTSSPRWPRPAMGSSTRSPAACRTGALGP
jgi:serine/threonine protein kinase